MNKFKLTKYEQRIEDSFERGEYRSVGPAEFKRIAALIRAHRKDAVLHVRVNSDDLKRIKQKAKVLGVKYQTFVSEIIHSVAHSPNKNIRAGSVSTASR